MIQIPVTESIVTLTSDKCLLISGSAMIARQMNLPMSGSYTDLRVAFFGTCGDPFTGSAQEFNTTATIGETFQFGVTSSPSIVPTSGSGVGTGFYVGWGNDVGVDGYLRNYNSSQYKDMNAINSQVMVNGLTGTIHSRAGAGGRQICTRDTFVYMHMFRLQKSASTMQWWWYTLQGAGLALPLSNANIQYYMGNLAALSNDANATLTLNNATDCTTMWNALNTFVLCWPYNMINYNIAAMAFRAN
jgi:hypothetical protein